MKVGFHGATTMPADSQTDVATWAHAGFQTLGLWVAKVDRFLADHSLVVCQDCIARYTYLSRDSGRWQSYSPRPAGSET